MKLLSLAVGGIIALTSTTVSAAPLWAIVHDASHLQFIGKQGNAEFKGEFKTFTPVIVFDEKDLASSSIKVTVETGSAITGDKTYDDPLPTSEWFNVAKFPEAVFQSTSIKSIDATHFEASGTLTMLGITKDLTLPFTLTSDGRTVHAMGAVTLKRLDFGLGQTVDAKGDTVSNDIVVKFDITAHQTK